MTSLQSWRWTTTALTDRITVLTNRGGGNREKYSNRQSMHDKDVAEIMIDRTQITFITILFFIRYNERK